MSGAGLANEDAIKELLLLHMVIRRICKFCIGNAPVT